MQTSGYGNDALMILMPVTVAIFVGVILFGGPTETLEVVIELGRDVAEFALDIVHAIL